MQTVPPLELRISSPAHQHTDLNVVVETMQVKQLVLSKEKLSTGRQLYKSHNRPGDVTGIPSKST